MIDDAARAGEITYWIRIPYGIPQRNFSFDPADKQQAFFVHYTSCTAIFSQVITRGKREGDQDGNRASRETSQGNRPFQPSSHRARTAIPTSLSLSAK